MTAGAARLAWALAFAKGAWFKVVQSDGLLFDSAYVPGAPGAPKDAGCVHLVLDGVWQGHGARDARFGPRTAFVATKEHFEGANGRRSYTYFTDGSPWTAVEMHFPGEEIARMPATPSAVCLDGVAWDAAESAARGLVDCDERVVDGICALVTRCADLGIVRAGAVTRVRAEASRPIARLWSAAKPMLERMALSPTLDDLTAPSGLTASQVEREMQRALVAFGMIGPGLRALTHHLRLKLAVCLLSADGATLGEVARLVGYGSVDAMARAFHNAGLPPPSVVQKELGRARDEPVSGIRRAPDLDAAQKKPMGFGS